MMNLMKKHHELIGNTIEQDQFNSGGNVVTPL